MSYSIDGGSPRTVSGPTVSIVVSSLGSHWITYTATDREGNTAASKRCDFTVVSTRLDITPIQGTDRIGTAIEVSKEAFPEGSDWVVIATGFNWPDALGGASLAGALDAPILLTSTTALPASVMTEIRRLGASYAYVLGGTPAVSTGVETALKRELGADNVIRLSGKNRYETSYAIAEETAAIMEWSGPGRPDHCFIATGSNFPDALGASPIAAAYGWPIVLVPPGGPYRADGIIDIIRRTTAGPPIILGSTDVVSGDLSLQLSIEFGPDNVQRIYGRDRYATAVAVARWATNGRGFTWDNLALATGTNFPDALAGGVLQGRDRSILLLTPGTSLNDTVRGALVEHKGEIEAIRYLGSDKAVSTAVRTAVQSALE
jgi:putative cell wall-binding protein